MREREQFEAIIRDTLAPDQFEAALTMEGDHYAEYATVLAWSVFRAVLRGDAAGAAPSSVPTQPEGWKLVPIEPTEDMVVNGFESWPDPIFSKPEDWEAYEAMTGCQQAAHKARLCYAAMIGTATATSTEGQS